MNNNIIPSAIIAVAIIGTGMMIRQSAAKFAADQLESTLSKIDETVQKRDADGKTRFEKIVQGVSSSIAAGAKAGFSAGLGQKPSEEKLPVRDKFEIKEAKVVAGRMKNEERVIGIFKNGSNVAVSNVQLVVIARDKEGRLIDVSADFARVPGVVKPGEEQGFAVQRSLGEFSEKEDALAQRKAATVSVSVSDFSFEK